MKVWIALHKEREIEMLRFDKATGQPNVKGNKTESPKAGSWELGEAHFQTRNGQRKALGLSMYTLPSAETESDKEKEEYKASVRSLIGKVPVS